MKIRISKDTSWGTYYRDLYKDEITEAMKEFKTRYTDNDLLRGFIEALDAHNDDVLLYAKLCGMDVLSCSVEVDFAGTSVIDYNNVAETVAIFQVNILARGYDRFAEIYFSCGLDREPRLWTWSSYDNRERRCYNVKLYEETRNLWDEDWKREHPKTTA